MVKIIHVKLQLLFTGWIIFHGGWYKSFMPWLRAFVFALQSNLPFWDSWITKWHIIAIWAWMVENINRRSNIAGSLGHICYVKWFEMLMSWSWVVMFELQSNLPFWSFQAVGRQNGSKWPYRPTWSKTSMQELQLFCPMASNTRMSDMKHPCHDQGLLCLHSSQNCHFETVG